MHNSSTLILITMALIATGNIFITFSPLCSFDALLCAEIGLLSSYCLARSVPNTVWMLFMCQTVAVNIQFHSAQLTPL